MPQPATHAHRYTPAWHAAEAAEERSWLDQWARLHLIPTTLPEPQHDTTPAPAPALAGRPR
jgi:hypothetical protein